MNAVKKSFNEIPATVSVPKEFIHKKGEIIFIVEEDNEFKKGSALKDFYGSIPDFPERASQGEHQKREEL
jgi:hypothetical protein